MKKLLKELQKSKIEHLTNPNFKDYSSIKLDQPFNLLIKPKTYKEIKKTICFLRDRKIEYSFIGNCTNSFITTNNIVLISLMYIKRINTIKKNYIVVSANCLMSNLALTYSKMSIKTFIGGTCIPGSIGAGIYINAGIKGICISKYLYKVLVLDLTTLKLRYILSKNIMFKYRESNLINCIILRLYFKKVYDNNSLLFYNYLKDYRKNQPNGLSLGSVFKNFTDKPSGIVLDNLGLKGVSYKHFFISPIHANFIISDGYGKAIDFYIFLKLIILFTYIKTGRILYPEVKILNK